MKTYRVSIIDWRYKNGKILTQRIITGLKNVRKHCPAKLHYSHEFGGFWGLNKNIECIAIECGSSLVYKKRVSRQGGEK